MDTGKYKYAVFPSHPFFVFISVSNDISLSLPVKILDMKVTKTSIGTKSKLSKLFFRAPKPAFHSESTVVPLTVVYCDDPSPEAEPNGDILLFSHSPATVW